MARHLTLTLVLVLSGIATAADDDKYQPIDLQPYANQKRGDSFGVDEQNNLAKLPGGKQTFGDVKFTIEQAIIQLGSSVLDTMPSKVEGVKVDEYCSKIHILHATQFGGGPNGETSQWFVKTGTPIGEYRINYEDKRSTTIPIVYGRDVRDWFYVEGEPETDRSKIVWTEENNFSASVGAKIRLYLTTWDNPKPEKKVVSIDYLGKKEETVAAPFCVAISLEK